MARIRSIEVRTLAPDVERFRYTAFEPEVFTTTTLVRVTDDDGTTGCGAYDSDSYGDWDRAPLETLRPLVPRLLGLDTADVEAAEAVLTDDRTSPFPPAVRSAVDIAMWDAQARATRLPLRVALGGDPARRRAPLLRLGRRCTTTRPPTSRRSTALVADGFAAVKLHAWGEPARDAGLIAAVRARFPVTGADARRGGPVRPRRAPTRSRGRAPRPGVRWLEGPLPDFDLEGYRELRRRVPGVPVLAAGDAFWDPRLWPTCCATPRGTPSGSTCRSRAASPPAGG